METVSCRQAAALADVDCEAVYRWIKRGRIKATSGPDDRLAIRMEDLEAFVWRGGREDQRKFNLPTNRRPPAKAD